MNGSPLMLDLQNLAQVCPAIFNAAALIVQPQPPQAFAAVHMPPQHEQYLLSLQQRELAVQQREQELSLLIAGLGVVLSQVGGALTAATHPLASPNAGACGEPPSA